MTQQPFYIVAEIKDDRLLSSTLTLDWTYEVYTDLREAKVELNDALAAGLGGHRIYEVRLHRVPLTLARPSP